MVAEQPLRQNRHMDTIPSHEVYLSDIPDRPSDLGFSHDAWWEGQAVTIARVLAGFGKADVVLLDAPTGSGKTLIGAAVGKIMGLPLVTLTHTLALQEQYRRTATWAVTAKGKNNFLCGHPEREIAQVVRKSLGVGELHADQCDEYLECIDPWRNGCPYFRSIGDAAEADQVILNYAYALRIAQSAMIKRGIAVDEDDSPSPNPFRRELAVLDEGHLASNAIVQASSLEFWHRSLKRIGLDVPSGGVVDWRAWAEQAIPQVDEFDAGDDIVLHGRVKALRGRLGELCRLNAASWIVRSEPGVTRIQPLWARNVYDKFLAYYPKLLIMSATLGDPQLLVQKLGLEQRQVAYVEVPSTFPKQNRPTFYWPVVKLSAKSDDGDYAALASAIAYIASQPHLAMRKGIVHTPSYKLVQRLQVEATASGMVYPWQRFAFHTDARFRDEIIGVFRRAQFPMVLVTPSLSTGFDFPYEIGFQIIAKVPFADLSDPVVRAQREYTLPDDPNFGKKCYDDDAMNQIVQAAGRAVRAPDDEGVSYILDENFWGLYKRAHAPEHFKETVSWLT